MTRKEQIKDAAYSLGYELTEPAFIAGAEWADVNPIDLFLKYAYVNELERSYNNQIYLLERKLATAEEALDAILKQPFKGSWDRQALFIQEVIGKIKGLKNE